MTKLSDPPFNYRDELTDESESVGAAWEDVHRRLRQTRLAIRRNRCELDAIYQFIYLRSRIRRIEREIVMKRVAAIIQTAQDPELRRAACDVLQAIEPGVTAVSGCRPGEAETDREAVS